MFRRQDPYTYSQFLTLYDNANPVSSGKGRAIGVLAVEYRVALYDDVQVQNRGSVALPKEQQFILQCTQRLLLNNPGNSSVAPITGRADIATQYFADYPALLELNMQVENDGSISLDLLDYSPQTVNTTVEQSGSSGDSKGSTTSTTAQSTTGSSYTQSSTYGVSVTVGDTFSGATASAEYSTSQTTESSQSTGSEAGTNAGSEHSNSASMSIKDWGSYAFVNPVYSYPTWVFGQEYPWNAIDCRYAGSATYPGVQDASKQQISQPNANQYQLIISNTMAANLCDGTYLSPPSELALFGLNFVMKGSWRIHVPYATSTSVTLNHTVQYFSASHIAVASTATSGPAYLPEVFIDKVPSILSIKDTGSPTTTFTVSVDLNVMGLDPLGKNAQSAIVGFLPARFIPPATITPPATSAPLPIAFKTIATTNDLIVENATSYGDRSTSGFSVSQACLTAAWSETQNIPYTLELYFKVLDSVSEYNLNLKHWVTGSTGVSLSIVINNDTSNTITRYVTAMEGEGGDNNLLSIALRVLDFASIDYHDFLQLGLNSVAITIRPIDDAWAGCGYQIRALSIT